MKRTIAILMFACVCTLAFADRIVPIVPKVGVTGFRAERNGGYLSVSMDLLLSELDVPSNRAVLLTPSLVNGEDVAVLPSVAVYGRRRYYYYHRNEGDAMLSGPTETGFRSKDMPESVQYHELLPFEEWMDGATVVLHRQDFGCCNGMVDEWLGELGRYREAFFPELLYVRPEGKLEKRRELEGRSYVDFPVDRTEIYPEYRRNPIELEVIRETIDVVRNDPDAKIDTVWLKGFASPESPYSHNTELAIGRTASLKKWIEQMYRFENVVMLTDYEPEDWEGLRRYVVNSNLEHRDEILALIDSDMEPDPKEWKIKSTYPEEYKFMLNTWYPALRHTDYRVSYTVRQYSDPKEILAIMAKSPQKLDQNEFYVAAGEYEPGTPEFTEVFETAVRMFPDDEVANLNAANAAMRRGDNASAERYLAKAGDSVEAVYARAALAIRTEDYATARAYLKEAADAGLEQAAVTLAELEDRLK